MPGVDKSRLITSQAGCPHESSDSDLPLRPSMWLFSDTAPWAKQGHHCEAQEDRLSVPCRQPATVESGPPPYSPAHESLPTPAPSGPDICLAPQVLTGSHHTEHGCSPARGTPCCRRASGSCSHPEDGLKSSEPPCTIIQYSILGS